MPTLTLKVAPLQNPPTYQRLAQALTRLSTQHLGKQADVTAVMIEDLPAARWFIGGEEAPQPTAHLEIHITAGTNTAAEKEAFIAAAYAELEAQLGYGQGLAPASYVLVRELPASDWGWGGRTQAARRLAAATNAPPTPHPAAYTDQSAA
ncbi:MAG: tautomerase family protein [Rhodoferax sp.]